MIEKYGMDGLTESIITSKRERYIADAPRSSGVRQVFLNPRNGADEVNSIILVFFDTGTDCKNIWIKNNVVRIKSDFIYQNYVASAADFDFRSKVSACPCSSNAMTTAAAPYI